MKVPLEVIGKRWAVPCDPPRTFDCWELVIYVRRFHGLHTPSVVDRADRMPSSRRHIDKPPTGWVKLDEPKQLCVARFSSAHVGVFLGGDNVIHCELAMGVRIDRMRFLPELTFWEFEHGSDNQSH